MFSYPQHQQILQVLSCLNAQFLTECQAYFGGGTLIAMSCDEHRQSRDIDFLCPFGPGYSRLRQAISEQSYNALFDSQEDIAFPREIRADQYGIRFPVQIGDTLIKFEIVAEGRIALDAPATLPWCPVSCLSLVDTIAEKLLANSDRWPDSSVASRDLIDLGILRQRAPFPEEAIAKAEAAYPVIAPLKRAIERFLGDATYQARCFESLQVRSPELVLQGIKLLAADLA